MPGECQKLYDGGPRADYPDFFRENYRLNRRIRNYKTVYCDHGRDHDGGGVGLSVHAGTRIATDNAMFAMPERIGLFPDVGGSWFLPRLPGELACTAMTGARLKAADCIHAEI